MTGEPLRVGVFVCDCGQNIAAVVDVDKVVAEAATYPHVVTAIRTGHGCGSEALATIRKDIATSGPTSLPTHAGKPAPAGKPATPGAKPAVAPAQPARPVPPPPAPAAKPATGLPGMAAPPAAAQPAPAKKPATAMPGSSY